MTGAGDVAHANLPLVHDAAVGMNGVHGAVQVHAFVFSGAPEAKPLAPAQQHVEVVVVVVVQPGRRAVLGDPRSNVGVRVDSGLFSCANADRAV